MFAVVVLRLRADLEIIVGRHLADAFDDIDNLLLLNIHLKEDELPNSSFHLVSF